MALCRELGGKLRKIRTDSSAVFSFVGYQFNLLTGRVLPTQDRWTSLQQKLNFIKSRNCCTVRWFMSLIGLLTATGKQVWSGRLHMRPIQWHLKHHWLFSGEFGQGYSSSSFSPCASGLVAKQEQCSSGTTFAPFQHALQIFRDASNEGWGAHLGDSMARGIWSDPESHLHIIFWS